MSTIEIEALANTKTIASKKDAVAFLGAILMAGINFHPDDRFEDYVNYDTDEPTFTQEQCIKMEALLEQCYEFLEDEELYEVLFAFLNQREGGEQ